MKLVGVAIIGKSNEPLYLCDCVRIKGDDERAKTTTTETASPEKENEDYFGFGLTSNAVHRPRDATATTSQQQQQRPQGLSLSMEHQLLFHASLDRLEEMVGASKPDGTMPLRRGTHNAASHGSWLGLVTVLDGIWAVYGYVSATNVKFLALCCIDESIGGFLLSPWSNDESKSKTAVITNHKPGLPPSPQQKIKVLLSTMHGHYVDYMMNPFSEPADQIYSKKFDRNVQLAILQYYDKDMDDNYDNQNNNKVEETKDGSYKEDPLAAEPVSSYDTLACQTLADEETKD